MRGDSQWFLDTVAQAECATRLEHAMLDAGLDCRTDAGFSAYFHFNQSGPLARQHRMDCLPVWLHETFKDWGGYQEYIDSLEGCETGIAP
jgi:hypothetical protein